MTKVLVVEDNPLNMELVVEILNSLGFEVFGAINGEDAIKEVEKEHYDLILMDIELPVMDGISALRIIKSKPEYHNVHTVALTALAMKGDKEKFLAAGFEDYISKPIDVPEFMKKMLIFKKS
ncbi:MAG TPA: response regulator [Candidatus Methanoperedens sp.]|nr:response regulator [Candidatus Methanoperedens sp.]